MAAMELVEIKVEIPAGDVAKADEVLQELAAMGWSVFEDVVLKRAWIVGICETRKQAEEFWPTLGEFLAAVDVVPLESPVFRTMVDADWRDSYKQHFKAWQFGRLHWVPLWERETFQLPAGDEVLWLDPGMAFGTGNHETTRLVVERLAAYAAERGPVGRVIDAGCGSGILALSAARLGFTRIAAFDNDPVAVQVSEENATLNGLAQRVEFFTADLERGLAGRSAELVMANIQSDVLMRFARELRAAVAPGGRVVLSGILAVELEQVCAAFARETGGWPAESQVKGEWADLALSRPA